MDNPETINDRENQRGNQEWKTQRQKTLEKTEGAIKNEQSRVTGNIGYTRHRTKTKKKPHK
jgi:hypothetical protein